MNDEGHCVWRNGPFYNWIWNGQQHFCTMEWNMLHWYLIKINRKNESYEEIYTDSFLYPGRLHFFSFRYLDLFSEVKREKAIADISKHIRENYEMNTLGIRMVNTLITQYFIQDGKLNREEAKHSTFQSKLKFGE